MSHVLEREFVYKGWSHLFFYVKKTCLRKDIFINFTLKIFLFNYI